MNSRNLETCLSTKLFELHRNANAHVVVIDILRATTSICAALHNGAAAIIPVATLDQARALKEQGYMVASERDGVTLDFADFGNSPFNFTPERVAGKEVAYSTTNGTQTIKEAESGLSVTVGAFSNISAIAQWLANTPDGDVLLYCAGWKGCFCLEDTLFAGALGKRLLQSGMFTTSCDSTQGAMDIWSVAEPNVMAYVERIAHRHRLKRLGLDDVLEYCFTPDSTTVVPILKGDRLVRMEREE